MSSAAKNIIVLSTYPDPVKAHLARTRLVAAGIPCFLSNEAMVSLNMMYSPVAGGVRLHVYVHDANAALEALRELPHMHVERGGLAPKLDVQGTQVICPRCGSQDIGSDVAATASWWAGLRAWLRRYQLQEHEYHCFGCGLNF